MNDSMARPRAGRVTTPCALVLFAAAAAFAAAPVPAPLTSFLDRHCLECHDGDIQKGGLDLTALPFDLDDRDVFAKWQRVFERVHAGEMPPAKRERPVHADQERILKGLKHLLVKADAADIAANGRVRGRRLTRVEYEYTLHDLLGIDLPLRLLLPEDGASHGFETVASAQQLSYHQLARYLDAADLALSHAFKRAHGGDQTYVKHHTPAEMGVHRGGNNRMPEHRGNRTISWPITLQFFGKLPATTVPEDGWYQVTLRQVQAINPGPGGTVWGTLRSGACSSAAPMLYMIGLVEATAEPRDLTYEAWIQGRHMLEIRPNDATQKKAPTGATGGNVSFVGRDLEKEGYEGIAFTGIDVERVYPNGDRQKVTNHLYGRDSVEGVKKSEYDGLIDRFAERAFRRLVTAEQTAPYRELARKAMEEGSKSVDALRAAYRAILCSPRFLAFIEAPGVLDDHALASRLSYAFWRSMPDAELLRLAAEGRLSEPAVLAAQVDRLLDDPKASRFITGFTDQWLKLSQIDFTTPDTRLYREFDSVVQESMLQETRTYFTELIGKDLPVTHLVDSDFAFLNERLVRHYRGEWKVQPGQGLQKVVLKPEDRRGGLVTQGAILKVTADGTSTSPVVRGVFINERLLGTHIPPPPPGVPAIEPDIRGATSIRDQLDKHRNNENCASCHLTIDPPGFALENYDPIGVWRVKYGQGGKGVKIDATGRTPDGQAFADIVTWKRIYTARADQLAAGFVRQFLTYATGAPPRFSEESDVEAVVARAATRGHGLRSLVREAVLSEIFRAK
jgi:hypothetical protein